MKKYLLLSAIAFVSFFAACKKSEVDSAPTADFVIKNKNAELNEGAALKLSNNSAASCKGLAYAWDFGNGRTSTEREPSVAYGMHGTYSVKLTVTDDKGRSSSISKEITVLCVFVSVNHAPLF